MPCLLTPQNLQDCIRSHSTALALRFKRFFIEFLIIVLGVSRSFKHNPLTTDNLAKIQGDR